MMNVWPPMAMVPCRAKASGFAVAEYDTVPLPLPLAPAVTVSHGVEPLTAVHGQPAGDVTDVDPFPPAAPIDAESGSTVVEQLTPDCVTVNVRPAIVTVPTRCVIDPLAATL
jgi:hypothetical protein